MTANSFDLDSVPVPAYSDRHSKPVVACIAAVAVSFLVCVLMNAISTREYL